MELSENSIFYVILGAGSLFAGPAVRAEEMKKQCIKMKLQIPISHAEIGNQVRWIFGGACETGICPETEDFVEIQIFPEGATMMENWKRVLRIIIWL